MGYAAGQGELESRMKEEFELIIERTRDDTVTYANVMFNYETKELTIFGGIDGRREYVINRAVRQVSSYTMAQIYEYMTKEWG